MAGFGGSVLTDVPVGPVREHTGPVPTPRRQRPDPPRPAPESPGDEVVDVADVADVADVVDVVGVAIVDDLAAPTVLLGARRTEPAALAGQWELPGGKVEPGESWEEALHREIAEELGVRIRLGATARGPLPDGRWQLSSRHVIAVWLAQVTDGEPTPLDEHDAVRWLAPDELDDVPWLPADRVIVGAIVADW